MRAYFQWKMQYANSFKTRSATFKTSSASFKTSSFALLQKAGLLFPLIALLIFAAADSLAQTVKPEIFAPGIISGPVDDAAPAFTPDGKTVYFHRGSIAIGGIMVVSHLENGKWSIPDVASFSGQWQDIEPAMAPDGSYMIFSSNRPVAPGTRPIDGDWSGGHYPGRGGNLWQVDRKGNGWSEPHRLPDIINANNATFSPAITADGTLYFMKPVNNTGKFHIFRSAYRDGQYQEPVLAPFSAPDSLSDVDPAVAPDESFLIFSSARSPIKGQLFIVFRKDGQWGIPVNMGEAVNRSTYNNEAKLSPDHRRLYFASTYGQTASYPTDPISVKQKLAESIWDTGGNNIWSIPLDNWLNNK
jgi:Tol biopolymer transport system component